MNPGLDNPRPPATGCAAIEVYVSHPFPHQLVQRDFIGCLQRELIARGLAPYTISAVESVEGPPLAAIRSRIIESYGLIVVAFRRMWVERGMIRKNSENPALPAVEVSRSWLTSSYCQIEPAMAYQMSLPILVLREHGIRPEGFLDHAADVLKAPEIDLRESPFHYFRSDGWASILGEWEALVRHSYSGPRRRFREQCDTRPGDARGKSATIGL